MYTGRLQSALVIQVIWETRNIRFAFFSIRFYKTRLLFVLNLLVKTLLYASDFIVCFHQEQHKYRKCVSFCVFENALPPGERIVISTQKLLM